MKVKNREPNGASLPQLETVPDKWGKVSGQRLLEILFPDEASRPTLRFLRSLQARRLIPFYKIGRLVYFDVAEAQEALNDRMRVNARWEADA
ncbi:hypothetical protein G0Q06_02180 [Puniceicoccales bacterium CK1056]|uniref:Helix-turn-helix domain-containing protein n=1 Tax=Oceanipulchritudo coccoides TaxID=2706888 RepID=A0A6B2LZ87_9BACT|nr:hypothetical protein [Oceanipulchritudo coccoides]NDV61254.1 hypothetical protein [Oceanipulchritudo coccoides]